MNNKNITTLYIRTAESEGTVNSIRLDDFKTVVLRGAIFNYIITKKDKNGDTKVTNITYQGGNINMAFVYFSDFTMLTIPMINVVGFESNQDKYN